MLLAAQLLDLLSYFILADVLLSWVQGPGDVPRCYTHQITEPLYQPLRELIPPQKTGGLDLSPLVWLFGIQFVASALRGL